MHHDSPRPLHPPWLKCSTHGPVYAIAWDNSPRRPPGSPKHIRSDNGSEFIAKSVQKWLAAFDVNALYIAPGAPWENGRIESFNSRVRDEFLEMNYFTTIKEARQLAATWKERYNTKRPHSSLKYLPPQTFAERCRAADGPPETYFEIWLPQASYVKFVVTPS